MMMQVVSIEGRWAPLWRDMSVPWISGCRFVGDWRLTTGIKTAFVNIGNGGKIDTEIVML